jgi:hypothetical protein
VNAWGFEHLGFAQMCERSTKGQAPPASSLRMWWPRNGFGGFGVSAWRPQEHREDVSLGVGPICP